MAVHSASLRLAKSATGRTRRLSNAGMPTSPPTPDVSMRRKEPTLWARSGRKTPCGGEQVLNNALARGPSTWS